MSSFRPGYARHTSCDVLTTLNQPVLDANPDSEPAPHQWIRRRRLTFRLPRRFRSSRLILLWIVLLLSLVFILSYEGSSAKQLVRQVVVSVHDQMRAKEAPPSDETRHRRSNKLKTGSQWMEEDLFVGSRQRSDERSDGLIVLDEKPVADDTKEDEAVDDSKAKPQPGNQDELPLTPESLHNKEASGVEEQQKLGVADEGSSLDSQADLLPDFIHIPFEDAVKDEKLIGWEDEWISNARFNRKRFGRLPEPRIDFVYLWVNGSDQTFQKTMLPWEQRSVLNDAKGTWLRSHGTNRYRDWDELRYSFRSVERNAGHFRNRIQVLVNSLKDERRELRRQTPSWLAGDAEKFAIQIIAHEEFFDEQMLTCLPTFNSLTIENQIFNVPSEVDQLFALSDDMLLGEMHSAADIYSPLFGSVIAFKSNAYSTVTPPTEQDSRRFGEKPYLIYTSWLLNRRFGIRKRRGQSHFGHSLSRSVMREALTSFPRPHLRSACRRFRGEPGFQLYPWYASFHYIIERHREALLWSYIMLRSDTDGDGTLSWEERQRIMKEIAAGTSNLGKTSFRRKNFYHLPAILEKAGLRPPQVNTNIQWTSLDGPIAIRDVDCSDFNVDKCLAPGFNSSSSSKSNPMFTSAVIFDRTARQNPRCGDCLIKILLNQAHQGLSPLLPSHSQGKSRELVVKALMRYKYTIMDPTDTLFVMVTDADQVDSTLVGKYVREGQDLPGQICLNDDVTTTDLQELKDVHQAVGEFFQGIFPVKCAFEKPM